MQHFILSSKPISKTNLHDGVLSPDYIEKVSLFKNISLITYENSLNKFYNIDKRSFIDASGMYYEMGYSLHKDESVLKFDVSEKCGYFNEEICNLDGNFMQLFVNKNGKVTIRRNKLSLYNIFYGTIDGVFYITSEPKLISKITNINFNEDFASVLLSSSFACWTLFSPYKELEIMPGLTKLTFSDDRMHLENMSYINDEIYGLVRNNKESAFKNATFRISKLIEALITAISPDEIRMNLTAGNDSRLNVALFSSFLKKYKFRFTTFGLPGQVDRLIGKYIADLYNVDNPYITSASNIGAIDYVSHLETLHNFNYVMPYSSSPNCAPKNVLKFNNILMCTGHFGNVVTAGFDGFRTYEEVIGFMLPNARFLSTSMNKMIRDNFNEICMKKFDCIPSKFDEIMYETLFVSYQKHNTIFAINTFEQGFGFTPFSLDIFFDTSMALPFNERKDNVLHNYIGRALDEKLYSRVPLENLKSDIKTLNDTFLLKPKDSFYFDTAAIDLKEDFYKKNFVFFKEFILSNINMISAHVDENMIKGLQPSMDRISYYYFVNLIGILKDIYKAKMKSIPISAATTARKSNDENYFQKDLTENLKFINLHDTYFKNDVIRFELIDEALAEGNANILIDGDVCDIDVTRLDIDKVFIEIKSSITESYGLRVMNIQILDHFGIVKYNKVHDLFIKDSTKSICTGIMGNNKFAKATLIDNTLTFKPSYVMQGDTHSLYLRLPDKLEKFDYEPGKLIYDLDVNTKDIIYFTFYIYNTVSKVKRSTTFRIIE